VKTIVGGMILGFAGITMLSLKLEGEFFNKTTYLLIGTGIGLIIGRVSGGASKH